VNPELRLCDHLAHLRARAFQPEVVHAFLFQDGAVDAIVRCETCDAHALLRLADWAPPDYAVRVYTLAPLQREDCATFLRNLARGSCQVARAAAELDALVAAAGRVEQLFAVDVRRERILAAGRPPTALTVAPGPFPERLPPADDARWFEALGLDKHERARPAPPPLAIAPADLGKREDADALLALLDAYACDPMGGGTPLPGDVKMRLVPDLQARTLRGDALVLIARRGARPVGIAVCFASYSTFRGRPVLNLHDLAVVPEERGSGVGRRLLDAVEDAARERRCCKVTLEVREDNRRAQGIYERAGFGDYAPGEQRIRTWFLEKKL
jgi:ribosomal protein S18 acetylase RimI-like enzyme